MSNFATVGRAQGTPSAEPNNGDRHWLERRYADLLEGGWPPELVAEHRGLLRHAVRSDIAPGLYIVPSAARRAGTEGPTWTRLRVRDFAEADLADYRVVFRRGLAGEYAVVPRGQVAPAFARIAEAPELAAARARRLCEGCDNVAVVPSGLCGRCTEAARDWAESAAHRRAARDAEQAERRRVVDDGRQRIVAELHALGERARGELARKLGVEPVTRWFDVALAELVEAGALAVVKKPGPTARGPRLMRHYRIADRRRAVEW